MSLTARSVLATLILFVPVKVCAEVFINELHYDDSTGSGDVGESIEVVATAGEDLSTYSIVLYNGATPGAAVVYDTDALAAGSPVSCGAQVQIAALSYPSNGIQNGGNDAIALVGPGDTVIQFLSYEGVATASNGPAAGMPSVDIGVSETNSTPPGTSLQLGGNGTGYADFTWNGSAVATPGDCNNGQTFGSLVDDPPELASSSPLDGALDVSVDTSIVLIFTESVTSAPDPWFALTCGGDPVAADYSGSDGTRSITPQVDLPFDTLCALDLDESRIRDLDDETDELVPGDGYTDFSFTTEADLAPSVASTTPADNAVGVAVNTNVTVSFSEPVSVPFVASDWIVLTCDAVDVPGNVGGGDTAYTFDPDALLTPEASCSVELNAANIADLDGVAQTLSGQTVFSFSVAPDEAPEVISTFPIDGAINFAPSANLTVVFSEPVDATADAFVIECPIDNNITHAVESLDQTTFTLNPDSDLPPDTDCVLRIVAMQISDMDGAPDALAADVLIDFTTNAGLAAYYERVDTSSCRMLRGTLHGVIDDHHAVIYSDGGNEWTPGVPGTYDVWEVLNLADEDPLDSNKILDIYRNESYTKIEGGVGVYNREHVWPNSHGFNDIDFLDGFPNAPYTDTHMLMVSNATYNTNRSNRAFAICDPALNANCTRNETSFNPSNNEGGGPLAHPGAGIAPDHNWYTPASDGGNGSYEVWDFRRGDLARGMLYMDLRYEGGTNSRNDQREPDLILTDTRAQIVATPNNVFQAVGYSGLLAPLLDWAQDDPPTPPEGLRNDIVESVQGNRNPFVDHPEWIAIAFANPCTGPVVVAVDDDFVLLQDTVLNALAPGVLRDDRNGANTNGQGLTASVIVPAENGVVNITNAATGAFTYTPQADFCGSDSFTYRAGNGMETDDGVAYLEVECVGEDVPPVAVADAFDVAEDAGLTALDVLANDTDDDGGPKTVQSVTQPLGGSTSIGPGSANVRFTPNANFCAATSFNYSLNGGSSAQVSISMTCSNDAPTIDEATFFVSENSGMGTPVGVVSASDVDSGDTLAFAITAGNTEAAFAIDDNGAITVANPDALDFELTPEFLLTVTVTDSAMPSADDSATITVTLSNVEEGPAIAANDAFALDEDSIDTTLDVLGNDLADPDGDVLMVVGAGAAQHGEVSFDASHLSYTPDADYCGADSLDYTIAGGDTATVSLTVHCINDAPQAVGSLSDRIAQEGVAIASFEVATGFADVDANDTLTYSANGLPPGLTIDPASGEISGTPNANSAAASPYAVEIIATDVAAVSAMQNFQFTVEPPLPERVFANGFED